MKGAPLANGLSYLFGSGGKAVSLMGVSGVEGAGVASLMAMAAYRLWLGDRIPPQPL